MDCGYILAAESQAVVVLASRVLLFGKVIFALIIEVFRKVAQVWAFRLSRHETIIYDMFFLPRCSIQMRDTPLYRCFLAETIIAWTKVGLVVFTFSVSMNHLALCVDESPRTLKSTGCVLSSHAGVLLALGGVFRFTTLQNTPDVKRTAICLVDAAICHYVSQNRDVYIGKHSQT